MISGMPLDEGTPLPFPAHTSTRPGLSQILGGLMIVFIWFAITGSAGYMTGTSWRAFLISADAAVILLPILLRISQGKFDLFEPLLVADAALASMMIFRPLADIATGHFHEHSYDISASFDSALELVFLANLAFQLGYASPLGKQMAKFLPAMTTRISTQIGLYWGTGLASLGIVLFGAFLATQGGISFFLLLLQGRTREDSVAFASSTAYLYNADQLLVPAATILYGVWLRARKPYYLIGAILTVAPFFIKEAAHGDRSGLIGVIFGAPIMWYAYHGKRPNLLTIGIGMAVLGIAFSLLRDARVSTSLRVPTNASSSGTDVGQAFIGLFTSDDDEMFDVIAQELEVVPNWVPYRPFGTVTEIIIRAIPRTLYPEKADGMGAHFFSIMEPERFRVRVGGTAPSIVGEFYLDSGTITVVFWMFITGAGISAIWQWYLANNHSLMSLLVFSTIPAAIVNALRGDLASYFAGAFFTLLPILILPFIQRRWGRSS